MSFFRGRITFSLDISEIVSAISAIQLIQANKLQIRPSAALKSCMKANGEFNIDCQPLFVDVTVHRVDEECTRNSKLLTPTGGGAITRNQQQTTTNGSIAYLTTGGRLLLAPSCSPRSPSLPASRRSLFPPRDRRRGNYH